MSAQPASFLHRFLGEPQPLSRQAAYAGLLTAFGLATAVWANPLLHLVQGGPYVFALFFSALGFGLGIYILHVLGRLGLFLAPFAAGLLFVFSHATFAYNLQPGPAFLGSIMETNSEEAAAFLTPLLVFEGVGCAVVYTTFVWWTRRFFSRRNMVLPLLLGLHVLFVQSRLITMDAAKDMRHASRWSMDYVCDPIKYGRDYFTRDRARIQALRELKDPAAYPSRRVDDHPLILVLVVGESLRADHMGINGYERDTTPLLAAEDLVNFPRARSFAAWTRESVIGIFTDATEAHRAPVHGSFVKLLRKEHFSVATYNSNTKPNRSDFSFSVLTEGAERHFAPRPDVNLVRVFEKNMGKGPLELHIFAPFGSHFSYRDGYPEEFARFQPDNYTRPVPPEQYPLLINGYDNTVLYTDYFATEIINALRDRDAVLIFLSDHGESLGEGGRLAHGDLDAPEQRHVPLFFWFSDTYKARHADRIAAMRAKTGGQVSHDNVFHTILGLAGIESEVIDPALDLSRPTP